MVTQPSEAHRAPVPRTTTLAAMIARPTERWRQEVTEQQAAVAAGTMSTDEAWAHELWPPDFTATVDTALATFERDVAALSPAPGDEAIWAAVERVVLALNDADEDGHIETGEREALCEYIDQTLTGAGIDVEALTARRGADRSELTDDWREW